MSHPPLVSKFTPLSDLSHITAQAIAAGHCHSAAISTSHQLYLWGATTIGCDCPQLMNNIKGKCVSIALGDRFGLALNDRGAVYHWGQLGDGDKSARSTPTLVATLHMKKIKAISAGSRYVIVLGSTV